MKNLKTIKKKNFKQFAKSQLATAQLKKIKGGFIADEGGPL